MQRLVGALVVVQAAEVGEGPLLGGQRRPGWTNGLALEGLVHALVRAVLLRRGREDPLVLNAQAQPPDVERRQPVNAARGEGYPVVRTNRARQAIFAKQAIEDRAHPVAFRREQAVAREEIAGVLVSDGQRITVDPVARAEMP